MEHELESHLAPADRHGARARVERRPHAGRQSLGADGAHPLDPARVLDVEITRPLPAIEPGAGSTGQPYRSAVALIRLHGQPLGTLSFRLEEGGVDPAQVAATIWDALEAPITEHLRADGIPCDGHLSHVRYLPEPQRGLSRARNAALAAARGKIIAFVDDDVVVDPGWLRSIVRGFRAIPGVACVTGMVLPAELETRPQIWFEEFGGFNKGYEQRVFDLEDHAPADPLYPFSAGRFGSRARLCLDREIH